MSIAKAAEQLLCRRSKLEVNTEKTEYMCVNVHEDADLMSLNGKRINKVSDFKYLGSKVSSTKNDLAHRRSLAWAAFKKLDKIGPKWDSCNYQKSLSTDNSPGSAMPSVEKKACRRISLHCTPRRTDMLRRDARKCVRR